MFNIKSMATMSALIVGASLTSCDDALESTTDNNGNSGVGPEKSTYAIGVSVDNTNILLNAKSLDEGEISASGNGLELDNSTYWIFHPKGYIFAMGYNDGAAGTGDSYRFNGEELVKDKTYTFARISTFGTWGDNGITSSTNDGTKETIKDEQGREAKGKLLQFNYLNALTGKSTSDSYSSENYLGNGEYVTLAGFVEANGKIYTSAVPSGVSHYGSVAFADKIKNKEAQYSEDLTGGKSTVYKGMIASTQYPDQAYIAVYDADGTFADKPTIITTDKIGYATGRKQSSHHQTIWAADNGDLYVFSAGFGRTAAAETKNKAGKVIAKNVVGKFESRVARIKKGEMKFDDTYGNGAGYVSIENQGNKTGMYRSFHITGNMFLLQMYNHKFQDIYDNQSQGKDSPYGDFHKNARFTALAIYNGETGVLTPLTEGLPSQISAFGVPHSEKGFAYIPVVTKDGSKPAIYKIDPTTFKATKGLVIDADGVTALGSVVATQK